MAEKELSVERIAELGEGQCAAGAGVADGESGPGQVRLFQVLRKLSSLKILPAAKYCISPRLRYDYTAR